MKLLIIQKIISLALMLFALSFYSHASICSLKQGQNKTINIARGSFGDAYNTNSSEPVRINFQTSNTVTPLGYYADTGQLYSQQADGMTYGWSEDVSKGLRARKNYKSHDIRYDTFAHILHKDLGFDATWRIALPNGMYDVTLVLGDPSYSTGMQSIVVENKHVITEQPDQYGFIKKKIKVNIIDSDLSISSNKSESAIAKIAYIEIASHPQSSNSVFANSNESNNLKVNSTEENSFHNDLLRPYAPIKTECKQLAESILVSWQNILANFEGSVVVISDSELAQTPLTLESLKSSYQNTDLQASSKMLFDTAQVKGKTLSVFAYSASGALSLPINIKLNSAEDAPAPLIKENIIEAAEELVWKDKPEVVNGVHDEFANYLYHDQNKELVSPVKDAVTRQPWQYVSAYSATLWFKTEHAIETSLEYSNNADFSAVERVPTENRKLHTHLKLVNNLKPQTQYFYRLLDAESREIKAEGSFVTKNSRDFETIAIDGHFPIILDKNDTNYLLTQDIQINTDKPIFLIKGNNISLDLGGHQVKVNNVSSGYRGIIQNTQSNKASEQINKMLITNGKLLLNSAFCFGNQHCKLINIKDIQQLDISGLQLAYLADQVFGIQVSASSRAFPFYKILVNHNTLNDLSHRVLNRHGSGATATITFKHDFEYGQGVIDASNNLIKRTRQNGIQRAMSVFNNEIYVDSWATNSFAIQPNSKPDKKAGRYTANQLFLTGYHAIGFGWAHKDLLVEYNTIKMQGMNTHKNRWWESFGDQSSLNGLRITNYGKGGQIRDNLQYLGNTIIGTARNGSQMRGVQFFSDSTITNTLFKWGLVDIRAEDTESHHVSAVVAQGTPANEHEPAFYKNSTLRSNVNIVRFGDYYGRGKRHTFENVRFEKVAGNDNFATFIFDGGYTSKDHKIINGLFENGARADDIVWKRTSSQSNLITLSQFHFELPENARVSMVGGQGNRCSLITSQEREIVEIDKKTFSKGIFFTNVESDGSGRCDLLQWPVRVEIEVDGEVISKVFEGPEDIPSIIKVLSFISE